MKRFLALTTLSALLFSCNPTSPPSTLQDQVVNLGQANSQVTGQSFGGTWQVENVPAWLSVSRISGNGDISLTVTANRNAATPVAADQKTLSGSFDVAWTAPDQKTSGTAHWTVNADQFMLTGAVSDTAQISATDLLAPATLRQSDAQGASQSAPQSVIVTYRSAALKAAVLSDSASSLQAQSVTQAQNSLSTLRSLGISKLEREPLTERGVVLRVAPTPEMLSALRADPNVENVTPSATLHALGTSGGLAAGLSSQSLVTPVTPTDQFAPLQWAYPLLGYGAVWKDMEAGGYTKPITVAVVDTGVRYDHPDLAGKLWKPSEGALDVLTDTGNGDGDGVDTDPTDPSVAGRTLGSHGTHVSGIIVASWGSFPAPCSGCSTSGVVGASYLAPIKVMPIRVLNAIGNGGVDDIINGLRYAAGLPVTISGQTFVNPHPAQVINLSLGGPISATEAQPMCDAVAEAVAKGSLVLAAAGNDGNTNPYYPAACAGAVSVASVTLSGASTPTHAGYSNSYAQVQLSAPGGTNFPPTYYNGQMVNKAPFGDFIASTGWDYVKNEPAYEFESGTSQATPQVSALAALLLSKGVTTGVGDTLARMIATATDLGPAGRDNDYGYGMINAAAALGAPPVKDTLGVRLQDAQGNQYQPPLDALGRFTAYLGDSSYQVVGGRDRNGNGIYGEYGEPRAEASATLNQNTPSVDLGTLTPR
ncbi:hypothetical protein Dxin01_00335 [Deinococcus xinjiangensis]|uniref:Peptidase S8/S53 domain-containing protein n=1 Tax=Deinococcus xinjiangensis TaxID=457454 RepID=A0ABP9V9C8_9DEIO